MPDEVASSDVRAGTITSGPSDATHALAPGQRDGAEANRDGADAYWDAGAGAHPVDHEARADNQVAADVTDDAAGEAIDEAADQVAPMDELGGSTEAFRAFVESAEPPSGRSAALLIATMAVGLAVLAVIFLVLSN